MRLRERIALTRRRSRVLYLLHEEFEKLSVRWEEYESEQYEKGVERGRMADLSASHVRQLRKALASAKQRAIEELNLPLKDVSDILLSFGYDDTELAVLEARATRQTARPKADETSEQQRWLEQGLSDLRSNLLWVMYTHETAFDSDPPTYAVYSLHVGIRAVMRMVVQVPNGRDILVEALESDEVPSRYDVQVFIDTFGAIEDPYTHIKVAAVTVPESLQAASRLLRLYEASVDWLSLTPHDLWNQGWANVFLPPDSRVPLEYGVVLYVQRGYSVKRITELTKIPRRQLVRELQHRGLMRYPGRPQNDTGTEVRYKDDYKKHSGPNH